MAEIVLGIGTSHGPMLVTETEKWGDRLFADKQAKHPWRQRYWSFDELVEERKSEQLELQITKAIWDERQARSQAAIEKLADVFTAAKPNIAVIVGNDQEEIFDARLNPALAILYGNTIPNHELSEEKIASLPPGISDSLPGYIPRGGSDYPGQPDLALAMIERAMSDGFDITAMQSLPVRATPHAFGFIYRRIMRDTPIPTVPVLLNTFYPPNQPTVRRCQAFGKSMLQAIREWESDARVAIIASGGLTHFVIDEEIDRTFLKALEDGEINQLLNLGEHVFQGGTSEMKNWVPVAGAMADLGFTPTLVDYVPCYRSAAGTGNAMGFVHWLP